MSKTFGMIGGGGGGIKLASIAITTPPAKTTYTAGETFGPAGMVVEATYSNGAKAVATGYSYTPSTALTDGTTAVTIQYTEGGVTKTAEQAITVVHRLESIAVTTQPSKTVYEYGDSFASAGMVVRATYSDGATANVTGYTTSPSTLSKVGEQTVTVSYTERGVTKTTTLTVTVERKSIATVPSQSGTLTYTGSAQSPIWSNYNAEQLTIGGVTSGANAGSYNATFTPTANYRWSDGSTTAKNVSWAIDKAAGSLSITPTSLTLDSSNPTRTINVTRAGNGTISAESSDTSVATVSVSGNIVTVTGQANGSAVITVSVAEGTNYTAPVDMTCAVSVNFVSRTLNDNDWASIRAVSDAGQGANYWSVGDYKNIQISGTIQGVSLNTLSSSITVRAFILGFNHNSTKEGSNRIHFQISKNTSGTDIAFCDSNYGKTGSSNGFRMNLSNSNAGGWKDSYGRKTLLGNSGTPTSPPANSFMAALPADLRAVMKSVTKYTDNTGGGGDNYTVTATTDYLFLLSEFEVQGARYWANDKEKNYQAQYDYYKAGNSKIKYRHDATGTAVHNWYRSAYNGNGHYFCLLRSDGNSGYDGAYASYGLAPGFAV